MTLEDGVNDTYVPTTAGDKDYLICTFFESNSDGTYSYSFAKISSGCTFADSSDPQVYTINGPETGLSTGTYLVRIEISTSGNTRTFDMPASPGRNLLRLSEDATSTITEGFVVNP